MGRKRHVEGARGNPKRLRIAANKRRGKYDAQRVRTERNKERRILREFRKSPQYRAVGWRILSAKVVVRVPEVSDGADDS